jgi:hypothetical protein
VEANSCRVTQQLADHQILYPKSESQILYSQASHPHSSPFTLHPTPYNLNRWLCCRATTRGSSLLECSAFATP